MKHVQACLSALKEQFSPLLRSCEARASLFKCQERARKPFSPLWGLMRLV